MAESGGLTPRGVREGLTRIGVFTARPAAFLILLAYAVGWLVFEPETLDWHGIVTMLTWGMTLFIQRAAHRDTQGIHAKLDELLKGVPEAREHLKSIDEREPEEIEAVRAGA